MATRFCASFLLGTLVICSLVLCSCWTAQHSEKASDSMSSSTVSRRLAIASSMSVRRQDRDLDSLRTGELDKLPYEITNDASQVGTALSAESLFQGSASGTIGVPVRNVEAEAATEMSSNSSQQPQQVCEYTVVIETGKQDGAGTDSDISVHFSNKAGDQVYFRHLSNGHRTFEKGHVDAFVMRDRPCVPEICRMVLSTDDFGFFSEWFVVSVRLSVATEDNSGLLRPVEQAKNWEIDEWLPKEDDKEELFTIRDKC